MLSYIVESRKVLQVLSCFFKYKKSMCITGTHTSKQYNTTELKYMQIE